MKKHIVTLIIGIISINGFAQIPSYVPTNGLVGWWPFNSNANDESGNGNNGTVNGATLTTDRNGNVNGAYSFNGVNCCGTPDPVQEIVIANQILNLGQDFTVSCWMNSIDVTKYQQLLFIAGAGVELNNEHVPSILTYAVGPGSSWDLLYAQGTTNNFQNSTWYHVVFIKTGTTYTLYLNKNLEGSSVVSNSINYNQTTDLRIGCLAGGHELFKGSLDDFGVWNRALTQQEISDLFNSCTNHTSTITPQGNTTFCQGGSVNLNASTGTNYTYEWYKDGQLINGATASVYQASVAGNYNLKVMDGVCNATSSAVSVVVNSIPNNGVTVNGNTTFCQGGSTTLTAQGTGSYLWSNGATNQAINVTQSGNYSVVVTQNGCSATSNQTAITVYPLPTATITPQSSTTFCQGSSVILNASTEVGNTYEWYKNGIVINGSITSSYTANQSGSYSVKVMNGACNATSSVTIITVNPNPSAIITPQSSTTFCQGGSVILNASSGSGNTYEWYKDGNIINGSTGSSYSANQSGNYTVKVINGSCNATSNATIVTINPNPLATITPQSTTTFCQGGSVILNGSTGIGYNYEWYKDGNIINGANTNFYIANQSGSYTVKVIDGSCNLVSSVTIVTVNSNPIVNLSLANFIHLKETSVTLMGSPSGGTYSGPGVFGSTFNSTNAGLGKKVIYYNYTSLAGCSGSATAITTVYDTTACSTFDTLFINVTVVGLTAPNNLGTLKIWPNPANDHIIIDNGNIAILSGYKVKIESILGQEVFKSSINQQQFSVDLSTWSGKGVYLVHIIDNQDNIIVTKKIVLQ